MLLVLEVKLLIDHLGHVCVLGLESQEGPCPTRNGASDWLGDKTRLFLGHLGSEPSSAYVAL